MAKLGAKLAAKLGGTIGLLVIANPPYEYVGDHATQAADDIISILSKPRTLAILQESVLPLQQIETALWNMAGKLWDIDNAGGAHLERIGALVDQERRDGWDDVTYRRRIRVRILEHMSDGQIEQLIAIALLILGSSDQIMAIRQHLGPACMDLYLYDIPSAVEVEVLRVSLGRAKAGGVSLHLVIPQDVATLAEVLVWGDAGGAVLGGVMGDAGGAAAGEGTLSTVVVAGR